MPFDANNTALIVIDMQGDFCVKSEDTYLGRIGLSVANTREPIKPLQIVLAELRKRNYTIIHTREGHRPSMGDCPELKVWRSKMGGCELGTVGSGASCCSRALVRGEASWDIIPELQPAAGEDVVDGCGKGKFVATDLDMILRTRGITTLVFGGVTTSCCVSTTMREATDLGYSCHVLSDCTGDCGAYDYMDTLRMAGGRVLCAQSFLDQVDASEAGKSARFPPLRAFKPSFEVSANIHAAMAEGGTLDAPSLSAKLAAEARAFISTLQQRAAAEGPKLDANGQCRSIVACDGGRTNAWPFKPAAFTPQTTAMLGLDLPDGWEDSTEPWIVSFVKLSSACAEAGVSTIGIDSNTDKQGEAIRGLRKRPAGAGAFSGTDLDAHLRSRGITNLLIAGGGASTAINTTMRQASDRGFDTLIVADCIGAAEEADLWGVTACVIRKAIFSACAHSDAVHVWLERRPGAWKSALAAGKRPRDDETPGGLYS